jgi:hypothetical protein
LTAKAEEYPGTHPEGLLSRGGGTHEDHVITKVAARPW